MPRLQKTILDCRLGPLTQAYFQPPLQRELTEYFTTSVRTTGAGNEVSLTASVRHADGRKWLTSPVAGSCLNDAMNDRNYRSATESRLMTPGLIRAGAIIIIFVVIVFQKIFAEFIAFVANGISSSLPNGAGNVGVGFIAGKDFLNLSRKFMTARLILQCRRPC